MSVCQRVGSPAGEALLEGYKPQPYTELVGGKTMAQVRAACWLPIFLLCFVIQICLMLLPAGHRWVARPPAFLCEAPGLFVCLFAGEGAPCRFVGGRECLPAGRGRQPRV